jgi:hypothetical protein
MAQFSPRVFALVLCIVHVAYSFPLNSLEERGFFLGKESGKAGSLKKEEKALAAQGAKIAKEHEHNLNAKHPYHLGLAAAEHHHENGHDHPHHFGSVAQGINMPQGYAEHHVGKHHGHHDANVSVIIVPTG